MTNDYDAAANASDRNGSWVEPYCRTLIVYNQVARQKSHAHRFIELMLSLDGLPIVVDYDGDVVTAPFQVVAPLRRHAILKCGAAARMYVAIGMRSIDSLRALPAFGYDDPGLGHQLALLQGQTASAKSEQITLAWQRAWLPDFDNARKIEPRIERAVRYIDVRRDPKTTRTAVAALAHLSTSRFAALFSTEMGMSLGRYIIWRRVLIALEYLKAGSTTTQAAAYAGFSDAPHFCRCYGSTFGSPPSVFPAKGFINHGAGLDFIKTH